MAGGTTIILAGDVMTGRGVDQILRGPGSPRLHEDYIDDARSYVALAEKLNGRIPSPVDDTWPWGEVLPVMHDAGPAFRVMNLETSVTRSEELAPAKAVHYRMSPQNVGCLVAAGVDVWTLANNHVLDHGRPGLLETLHTLDCAGLSTAGAGRDASEAWSPRVVESPSARLVVCSVGHVSSGVPRSWAAGSGRPGVALLPDLSDASAEMAAAATRRDARPGDLRLVSVHWGGNWGYDVPQEHQRFAHRLVDAGVHLVHGHSSHHPRPIEVYHGGLVLYGCGDLVNDYEGIGGYELFRDDLRLLYVASLAPGTGEVSGLRMVPFQSRQLRLWRAGADDSRWLAEVLDRVSRGFGTSISLTPDGSLALDAAG